MKAKLFFIGAMAAAVCSCATMNSSSQKSAFTPESVKIELDGNPTTGFSWECEVSNPGIVKIEKSTEQITTEGDDRMMVGVPSKFIYKITSVKEGETKLTFKYRRPWENVQPAEEKTCNIKVAKDGSIQKDELK